MDAQIAVDEPESGQDHDFIKVLFPHLATVTYASDRSLAQIKAEKPSSPVTLIFQMNEI